MKVSMEWLRNLARRARARNAGVKNKLVMIESADRGTIILFWRAERDSHARKMV
jgi:hypothetical protein